MDNINYFLQNLKLYPFHMPGHKRNKEMFQGLPIDYDITEINGADDLHNPHGIIKASMEEAAMVWGSKRSYYLVNGSTCGILAGITTLSKRGDKVLCARNCHRSVFHALEVGGLVPTFISPLFIEKLGVYGSVSPNDIATALDADSDIKLVIIVSPTYEGVLSDVKSISDICHTRGVSLFVDEAHGAHLDLSTFFTGSALTAGADIVVQSLHKTLPSLTQTAILHTGTDRVDVERLEHKLRVFETSSPSYLLMRSAEYAVNAVQNKDLFSRWSKLINTVEESSQSFLHIKLAFRDSENAVFAYDKSRLVFIGVNGIDLSSFLQSNGIEAEYATNGYLVALTGAGDSEAGIQLLLNALTKADEQLPPYVEKALPPFSCPKAVCSIEAALDLPSKAVPVDRCVGETSAEYVWAYPPGIPILIPGEQIPTELLQSAANLESDSRLLPNKIKVLC